MSHGGHGLYCLLQSGISCGHVPLNCHHGHRFCLQDLLYAPIMAGDG